MYAFLYEFDQHISFVAWKSGPIFDIWLVGDGKNILLSKILFKYIPTSEIYTDAIFYQVLFLLFFLRPLYAVTQLACGRSGI